MCAYGAPGAVRMACTLIAQTIAFESILPLKFVSNKSKLVYISNTCQNY